jgi:hypothetical protein
LRALRAEARTPGTELHRLASRNVAQTGDGVQYALVATRNGPYPVMRRGSSIPVGTINLKVGDVWKYGETINPGTRYTRKFLEKTGLRLLPQAERLTRSHRRQTELARLVLYRLDHGRLPPGNKILR